MFYFADVQQMKAYVQHGKEEAEPHLNLPQTDGQHFVSVHIENTLHIIIHGANTYNYFAHLDLSPSFVMVIDMLHHTVREWNKWSVEYHLATHVGFWFWYQSDTH